ncbi:MAG: hypothetical protein H7Y08_04530 [Rhizobiaceae bacterium]|nr:hypothetical protein [Rhizobiaceae bacterium]
MPTIGWADVDWKDRAGHVAYRDMTLVLRDEHIAGWKDDPEARYAVDVAEGADGSKRGELVKLYPSL